MPPADDIAASCSDVSRQTGEPLAGTAPQARTWLVIEQHGGYGRKALLESRLPGPVGRYLSGTRWEGVKVMLARPSGRRNHDSPTAPGHAVWLADAVRGRMVTAELSDPSDLLTLNPATLAEGELPDWPEAPEPRLFVCTNGRRDACCARVGRAALQDVADPQVWECSHLGGHRFAATGVLLPWGYLYGRLTPSLIADIMADARRGTLHPAGLRGRSMLSRPAQAADIAVRARTGLWGLADVMVAAESAERGGHSTVDVRTSTGARHRAVVVTEQGAPAPESCAGAPVPVTTVRVADCRVVDP